VRAGDFAFYFYGKRNMRERIGAWRILVGKSKGKKPLGWPRRRWEDNIKMDLQEVRWRPEVD
jgi:hypothetical protein